MSKPLHASGWYQPPNVGELRQEIEHLYSLIPKSSVAITSPAVTDDESSDFQIGSRWYDTSGPDEYVCVDATEGAAVWKQTT